MVCSVGSGRMAVMARLLEAGSYSQNIAGELGNEKLAARHIDRELCEADEANLLDEEDMHVFGLEPMSDPLYLVCCNACKKPIKASQYAAHAELCRLLKPREASVQELDGARGHRKPPRKERKKSTIAYTTMPVGVAEQERSEMDNTTSLEPHANWQHEFFSPFHVDLKRNSSAIDTAPIIVDSGVGPQNTDKPVSLVESSTKRYKMIRIPGECAQPTDDSKKDSGKVTARDCSRRILSRTEMPNTICKDPARVDQCCKLQKAGDCSGGIFSRTESICKDPAQVDQCCELQKGLPVPLTAKIYYSQRNSRFRLALTHLYHETSKKEICGVVMGSQAPAEGMELLQASSLNVSSPKEVDHCAKTKQESSGQNPGQMVGQSSEASLIKSGEYHPDTNLSNQLPVEIVPMPQAAAFGLTRSKYVSKPYSFVGNSGQLLGTIQQQNGSVPVV